MTEHNIEAPKPKDNWAAGDLYEPYVGRWSRLVAREFIKWLGAPAAREWLDVGCGTGALTQSVLDHASPKSIRGIDPSAGFVEYASTHVTDPRARFEVADAESLPYEPASVDVAVSGLVLNFVPHPERAVAEMARVTRPGGRVAAYVWDYAGKMELMRHFWDAVVTLDPNAGSLDEGNRFPMCKPEPLAELFRQGGLHDVETRPIDAPTVFASFDDYWTPFLGGQGPAPSYATALGYESQTILRDFIRSRLPKRKDGSIHLIARAWAVRGNVR